MSRSLIDRFAEKIALDDNGCLIWLGAQSRPGQDISYGIISYEGKPKVAHRAAWFLEYGEWPPTDMDVDHLCYVTLCVNVHHLEVVSRTENNRRRRRGWTARKNPDLCSKELHPWVPDNLIEKGGYLTCKRCYYDRNNEWHRRQKGKQMTCDCVAHEWIGRECTCTCDHSKKEED